MKKTGVCAAKGFSANGIHCGIRKNKFKRDLALIYSEKRAACAAAYTTNLVKGATITVTRENIADGWAQAIVCNSGNANTCNANGPEVARRMCDLTAKALDIQFSDVVVASTGVIGKPLDITPIENGMDELARGLDRKNSTLAEQAIMTTDTREKEADVKFTIGGKECRIGGIAKGSGMIHPNMATMLCFITTDAAITPDMLQKAVTADVADSFNMASVDGDTSTNDMLVVMANGMAGNDIIGSEGEAFEAFKAALHIVTVSLCRMIAGDGEGATKLLECIVTGAASKQDAVLISKAVICSPLVKSAMFGSDANWGRVLCAAGYAGANADVGKLDLDFRSHAGEIAVCRGGAGIDFSEETALKILKQDEIQIIITLHDGEAAATAWGCDLTYDYVRINGEYRT